MKAPILDILCKQYPAASAEGKTPIPRRTKVINVKGRNRAELLADPNFVYVGRRTRNGWPESPWGNPFATSQFEGSDFSRQYEAVAWFTCLVIDPGIGSASEALRAKRDFIRAHFHELGGKTLGCWCCDLVEGPLCGYGPGELCHAVILARLADGELLLDWQKPGPARRRRKAKDSGQARFDFAD
jgi:hypothetical protein